MSTHLPPQASLRQLKIQAKELHRAHQAREPQALQRLRRHHPRYERSTDAEVAEARLTLQDAQLVLAREYGFESWPRLTAAVGTPAESARPGVELIGTSAAIQRVRDEIERAAACGLPVLIVGELGVGKRLVARAIHVASRREGPLVQVACGAPDGTLGEAELFGYEPGAFTGAHTQHPGQLESADSGTLVLEEIDGLSPEAQARLQAFVEHGTFRRLGGTEDQTAEVRLVATTSRDLRERVTAGAFREDLYYQIEVLRLEVPSLHERGEDLPALAAHFAAAVNQGRAEPVRFSPEALERLAAYDWPGNVRELRRVVERVVAAASGNSVGAESVILEAASGSMI
ncbi:MAG: sigma 54-interacting transcriptional regulator [Candidatus Latescibacterota bacterium]|jgi:DNA-binding NtrC family response regulator